MSIMLRRGLRIWLTGIKGRNDGEEVVYVIYFFFVNQERERTQQKSARACFEQKLLAEIEPRFIERPTVASI